MSVFVWNGDNIAPKHPVCLLRLCLLVNEISELSSENVYFAISAVKLTSQSSLVVWFNIPSVPQSVTRNLHSDTLG